MMSEQRLPLGRGMDREEEGGRLLVFWKGSIS